MDGQLTKAATVAVMLGVVVAFVAGTGYLLVERPEAEPTGLMVGALVAGFTLILNRLFGKLD